VQVGAGLGKAGQIGGDLHKGAVFLHAPHNVDLRYFITEGHIDHWLYSTPESRKRIETDFAVAACNPV